LKTIELILKFERIASEVGILVFFVKIAIRRIYSSWWLILPETIGQKAHGTVDHQCQQKCLTRVYLLFQVHSPKNTASVGPMHAFF
jgi:hypothetical protein